MIKRISELDLQNIIEIERESFDNPWTIEQIHHDILEKKVSNNWGYYKNTHLIGYIFGWIVQDEYHLTNIAIKTEFKRQGIASSLLNFLLELLRKRQIKHIFLEVSNANQSAQRLYERFDFISVGIRKDYYGKGDDAILYTLELE
jgi:[ribosomal protein S18]-alanine N-acetyltransferase